MSTPIPYTVQSGETLQDIAKKLGIKDWTKLQEYHNNQVGSDQKTSTTPYAGFRLMTPPKDDIYTMNGETPPLDPAEEQKNNQEKQDQEKKKEEEEKKNEQASKSEHDGKYFVVHNAKCVCDKAENPKQTANLQVTTHSIIVLNDEQGKLAATEEDKTFNPPAATFGKCTLKPSSGGYLPCALAPAPKWGKTYESTQVMGKNTLTEISELQCTVGGKITVFNHGQTDSVSNAHADNTNPVELAMVNPAIAQPKKKEEYPVVTSITLIKIENRASFKETDSKNKNGIIYLRKDEEASFKANLKSGNKQFTSWMVYNDHQGKKESRVFLREQIGTEFSQSFDALGKYRIEGYGKPKTQEFEKGKYDKCDPTCSIDVEVIENTLIDIECTSADFTSRLDPSKNRKFRKGVPSVFKAKFFISDLTAEEKSKLILAVLDGTENMITEGVQINGDTLTFTPKNSKAKYTIVARYTNDQGEVIEKKMSGETEGNAVLGISHGAEVVRPGTAMNFSVSKMKYKLGDEHSPYGITSDESTEIKWNLNGVLQATGKNITIPGSRLMVPGKYVVEAYSITANATGKNAKKEDDDWHFEVKENDVLSFTQSTTPKVGKPVTLTVNKMVFADLHPNEIIHWKGFSNVATGKSITFTPSAPGKHSITCSVNNRKGITQSLTVVEAKIIEGFWHDLQGNEISKASWGQKVFFSIGGENLKGENLKSTVFDKDTISGNDFAANKDLIFGDSYYSFFELQLDKTVQGNTASSVTPDAELFVKSQIVGLDKEQKDIVPKKGTQKYLSVTAKEEVCRALIGDYNGKSRHNPVDYDIKSWVYANTTFPKDSKLKVKIFEDRNWEIDPEMKELTTIGTVGEDGSLVTEINWGKLKDAKQNKKTKKYYVRIYNEKDSKLFDGSESDTICNTVLIPQSELTKLAGNVGAVRVGSEQVPQQQTNGACACKEFDLSWGNKFTCDERKKVVQICTELWEEARKKEMANHLMNCMALETGEKFKPDTGYSSGGATGLVQWTGSAIDGMNKNNKYNKGSTLTKQKLASMTVLEQLDYVKLYFKMWMDSGKVINDSLDMYMCIWCPAAVGKEDSFVCYSETNSSKNYNANKSIDGEYYREKYTNSKGKVIYNTVGKKDGDGEITKGELRPRLKVKQVSGISYKETNFTCDASQTPLNAKDIVTFHIYEEGKIEKHIPKSIKEEYKNKYKYVYHDKDGKEHNICIMSFVIAQNWIVGSKVDGGKGWEKRTAGGKTRYYQKGNGQVELLKVVVPLNYSKDGVNIKIGDNTEREYINPLAFASMLGSVAECGYNDFNFNGSTSSDGTGAPSVTHVNGVSFDFRYLRKDKTGNNLHIDLEPNSLDIVREEKFIDALIKFGYSKFYSYNIIVAGKPFRLKNSTHLADHNHHLHIRREGYNPKYKEIKE